MSSAAEVLRDAADRLRAAGMESARLEARLLLAHAMGVEPSELISTIEPPTAGGEVLERFESYLARRLAHEPLAYILGTKEFWSLDFAVGPGALIPRPETETLIEQAIAHFPDRAAALEVLDLGTGTGCLLIAFLGEYPNARGLGIDASPQALGWARRNVARHRLEGRCRLATGEWGGDLAGLWDVILCNPPYIRSAEIPTLAPDVGLYEPTGALDGGPDGLAAYRVLAPQIGRLLMPDGLAFLETGAGQAGDVAAILAGSGLETRGVATDLAGIGRCVVAGRPRGPKRTFEKTVGTAAQNR